MNIVGVVENYTGDIFGQGAGSVLAKEVDTEYLGSIALRQAYQDTSRPTVLLDDEVSTEYDSIMTKFRESLKALGREAP